MKWPWSKRAEQPVVAVVNEVPVPKNSAIPTPSVVMAPRLIAVGSINAAALQERCRAVSPDIEVRTEDGFVYFYCSHPLTQPEFKQLRGIWLETLNSV